MLVEFRRVNSKTNVVLVGPMGSGKTAVGRHLARELEMEFVDSDMEIERRTGVDITFIFDKEGEQGFRERECAVLADLVERHNVVLATGGGAILDAGSRKLLRDTGIVVYLKTSVAHQARRTRHARNRPLLPTDDPAAVLGRLMSLRGPLYEAVAHITVVTADHRIGTVAGEIKGRLREIGFASDRCGAANASAATAQ